MTTTEIREDVTLQQVPLAHIEDPHVDIRNDLRTSMESMGQRIPVRLRQRAPKRKTDPPRYDIVDGKHRVAVAAQLGWETIRAEVEPIGKTQADKHDRAKELLVANAVRERNLGAEAEAVDILLSSNKFTPEQISKETGVALRTVKELEAMKHGLVKEAFNRVKDGTIPRGAAMKMLRLDPVRQKDLLETQGEEPVKVADAEEAVRDQRNDMLDRLDKVRPQAMQDHSHLGHAVAAVAGQYTGQKKKALEEAAAILRGEGS
jgi:ParB-like chromosome segregation protein Spo0J